MKKQISDKEVDLIELLLEIWANKLKILIITTICVACGGALHLLNDDHKNKTLFKINSEVHPISIVEETKYRTLNSYVNDYSQNQNINLTIASNLLASNANLLNVKNEYNSSKFGTLNFDKKLLFQLFIKKISSQKNLENYLYKFKLYKKDDYKNDALLIKSFSNILDSVKNVNFKDPKPLTIKIQTHYYEQTLEFLEFINEKINIEVKGEINDIFASHIETKKLLKKFELDDVEQSLEIFGENNSKYLSQKKQYLLNDKYIDRIKVIYSDLPPSDGNKFYAAKIIYQSSSSKNLNRSYKKNIIVSGLVGILISIIIVLTSYAIRMREVK